MTKIPREAGEDDRPILCGTGVKGVAVTLHLPSRSLVLLCGAPGSGKSTFAERHFLWSQVVSSDRCREMVCDDEENMAVHREAFSLLRFIVRLRLSLGRFTVIDSTALERKHRTAYVSMAAQYNFHPVAILFDVPYELCLRQNESRSRRVPPEAIRHYHNLLQKTKISVRNEGFDRVFILNPEQIRTARIAFEDKDEKGGDNKRRNSRERGG
jgi:predicted kinase